MLVGDRGRAAGMAVVALMLLVERWQEHVKIGGVRIDLCGFLVCRGEDHAHALVYPQDVAEGQSYIQIKLQDPEKHQLGCQ